MIRRSLLALALLVLSAPAQGQPAAAPAQGQPAAAPAQGQPAAAPAQGQPAAAPAPPDVPHGDATLHGRVVHAEDGSGAADVEVLLYALPADAPPGLRRGRSGPDGRFTFTAIDHNPATTYLVGARYREVSYPGARFQFGSGEREREIEVPVHEVAEQAAGLALDELHMRLDWNGDRIEVSEEFSVANPGAQTVYVGETRRAGHAALLELPLPAGAGPVVGPLGLPPEGALVARGTLAWFGPVYPGGSGLEYQYSVPAPQGKVRLARALPGGRAVKVTILAPASGPKLEVAGLAAGEPTVVQGRGYRTLSGDVSDRLALDLEVPAARHDASAVSLGEVRLLGELDAAAYDGREEHVIEVSGETPVVAAADDEPLLRIPLPTQATDLRFGSPESATRLVPLADGSGIGVLGPLAPGETVLEVRYRLPSDGSRFTLSRHFAVHVPLFSVYLADSGRMRLTSERLHRRRPASTPDRTYLHLEAFELAPNEEAAFTVETLPPRSGAPRLATISFVALATGFAVLALAAPLRRGAAPAGGEGELESAARREREALTSALRDLEHDHETGKLDPADYGPLRDALRQRALRLLASERGAGAAPPAVEARAADAAPARPARFCTACGQAAAAADRFCAQCGAPLA